jgi:hypothetical protein
MSKARSKRKRYVTVLVVTCVIAFCIGYPACQAFEKPRVMTICLGTLDSAKAGSLSLTIPHKSTYIIVEPEGSGMITPTVKARLGNSQTPTKAIKPTVKRCNWLAKGKEGYIVFDSHESSAQVGDRLILEILPLKATKGGTVSGVKVYLAFFCTPTFFNQLQKRLKGIVKVAQENDQKGEKGRGNR